MSRILIDVTNLLKIVTGYAEGEAWLRREVRLVIDDINDALPDYECMLAHLEGRDYLVITLLNDEMRAERKRRYNEAKEKNK